MAGMARPMFLEFYKLREQPFGDTPDPRFAYLSLPYREALASLFYGIDAGRGFLALIAEPGMGKTTILFQLLEALRSSTRTVFLFQTQCDSRRELLAQLLADLGIDVGENDLARMYLQLRVILLREARAGRRVVVIVDEAQNLTEPTLETLRLLSDFESPQSKLMQIVLAGQPQLETKLASPELTQLRQRISILSRLRPLGREETSAYIDHRLEIVGRKRGDLFTPEARRFIAYWSEGVPRRINHLCFNALSLGCALRRKEIDGSLLQEAANDLEIGARAAEPCETGQARKCSNSPVSPAPAAAIPPTGSSPTAPEAALRQNPSLAPGANIWQLGRTVTRVGAAVIAFSVVAAATVFSLRSGTAWPPEAIAASATKLVRSRVSVAAKTLPAAQSGRTPVVARYALLQTEKRVKGKELPSGNHPALPASTPRATARLERALSPDLTGAALKSPEGAMQAIFLMGSRVPPPPRPAPETAAPAHTGRLRPARLTFGVKPRYPPAAEQVHLEGKVVVAAVIGVDGNATDAKVVSGPALLRPAALDAIRECSYAPAYLDDKPVPMELFISVEFQLP
jgi:TonB family protein